jgi:hypothetical protein
LRTLHGPRPDICDGGHKQAWRLWASCAG